MHSPETPTFSFLPETNISPATIEELLQQRDEHLGQVIESHVQDFGDLTTAYTRDLAEASPATVPEIFAKMPPAVTGRLETTTASVESQIRDASSAATTFLSGRDATSFRGPLQEALKWGLDSRKVKELVEGADSPLTMKAALDETTLATAMDMAERYGRTHPHVEKYLDMASTATAKQAMRSALDGLAFRGAQDLAQKFGGSHPSIRTNEDAASSPAVRRAMAAALDGEVMRGLTDLVRRWGVDHPQVTTYLAGASSERVRQLMADQLHIPENIRPRKPEPRPRTTQASPHASRTAPGGSTQTATGASGSSSTPRNSTAASAHTPPHGAKRSTPPTFDGNLFNGGLFSDDFLGNLFGNGGLFGQPNNSRSRATQAPKQATRPNPDAEAKPVSKVPQIDDIDLGIVREVDAAAAELRKQGVSEDKLHRALVRRFHPEGQGDGSAEHMRVVTNKYKGE